MAEWGGFEHNHWNLCQKRLTSQRTLARGHGDPHPTMMAPVAARDWAVPSFSPAPAGSLPQQQSWEGPGGFCAQAAPRHHLSWCFSSSSGKLSHSASCLLTSKATQPPFCPLLHSPSCTRTQFLTDKRNFLFKATSETTLCTSTGATSCL